MARFDKFLGHVKGGKYGKCTFEVATPTGHEVLQGLWVIVDGGYHRWRCLQCPSQVCVDRELALWSRWLESVRKDVECVFLGS